MIGIFFELKYKWELNLCSCYLGTGITIIIIIIVLLHLLQSSSANLSLLDPSSSILFYALGVVAFNICLVCHTILRT